MYFAWITEVETIKNGRLGLRTALWLQAKVCAHKLELQPTLYAVWLSWRRQRRWCGNCNS